MQENCHLGAGSAKIDSKADWGARDQKNNRMTRRLEGKESGSDQWHPLLQKSGKMWAKPTGFGDWETFTEVAAVERWERGSADEVD